MGHFQLPSPERRKLFMHLKRAPESRVFRRAFALLEVAAGKSVTEVAQRLGVDRSSVHRWIDWYRQAGTPQALLDQWAGGRPTLWTEELKSALCQALRGRPHRLGYQATDWTAPLLQHHLAQTTGLFLSDTTIRRKLHELRRAWKRPRHVLVPDPELEKKTADPTPHQVPQNQALPLQDRHPLRGRNRAEVLSSPSGRLGNKGSSDRSSDYRLQRSALRLRRDQSRDRASGLHAHKGAPRR